MACASPLREAQLLGESLGYRPWDLSSQPSEGLIAFLPRLSEKRSTRKNGLVGCELGRWLDLRDCDGIFIRGSLWVIQEEINTECLTSHQRWLLFEYCEGFCFTPQASGSS